MKASIRVLLNTRRVGNRRQGDCLSAGVLDQATDEKAEAGAD